MSTITAADLKQQLADGEELALLDVREPGQYGEGHPLLAVNLPYSRLELDARARLPRPAVRCVVLDDGDGVAARAVSRLRALGFSEVSQLQDGARAWSEAGYTLFKGVNVPSKAFGELVEHAMHTPSISAAELEALRAGGKPVLVLDGRTPEEFSAMSIPGARSCPNAELAYRLDAFSPGAGCQVVINCAGRTRSIIGAQGLRSLGLKPEAVALRNGTQGWRLNGLDLDRGQDPGPLPEPDPAQRQEAARRAGRLLERIGVACVEEEQVRQWQQQGRHSVYLLDVRSAREFDAGHAGDAVHAPGGQLVQATDQWVAVRNARLVLCDDTLARAATTAMWLTGMGHQVSVLRRWSSHGGPVPATERRPAGVEIRPPGELPARLAAGARIIDVSPSMAYRQQHIRGATWCIRPRLPELEALPGSDLILVGRDPGVAALAAAECLELGAGRVGVSPGGPAQWREAGLDLVSTDSSPPDDRCIDFLFFVHDRHLGNLDAARAYLEWETGLVAQLDEQERGLMSPQVPVLE